MKKIENLKEMGQFIRHKRREKGLTLDQLAAATGISKPYLSNIETARMHGPASEEKLRRLEGALEMGAGELVEMAAWLRTPESVRALFTGEVKRRGDGAVDLDAMIKGEAERDVTSGEGGLKVQGGIRDDASGKGSREVRGKDRDAASEEGNIMKVEGVPLINRVAAGEATEYTDLDYPVGVADAYLPLPTGAKEVGEEVVEMEGEKRRVGRATVFAVRVEGESMLPEYRPGDIVVVSGREALAGQDCLVRLGAEENFATTLKRIFYEPAEGRAEAVRLVPLNGRYPQRVVSLEKVTGIYPVIWRLEAVGGGKGGL